MTIAIRFAIFLMLLPLLIVQGCAEKFDITETVCLGIGNDKLAIIDLKGQRIARITDFWMCSNYLYGYRYRDSVYEFFVIDLRTSQLFEGKCAQKVVCRESLPMNQWTNAMELFCRYVSDKGRRYLFIKSAQEFERSH